MPNFLGGLKDKISGLLTGVKAEQRFLPMNDLLQQYGMGEGSLFKVRLKAFKTPDVKITNNNGIKVERVQTPTPMGEFEILYSADSLVINHTHNFGESKIGKKVNDVMNKEVAGGIKVSDIAAVAKAGIDLFGESSVGQTDIKTDWNTFGSIDFAQAYQGSVPPEFTLTFTLIASRNPLIEVVAPCVMFTFLSYPKLSKQKDMDGILSMIDQKMTEATNLSNTVGIPDSSVAKSGSKIEALQNKSKKLLESSVNVIKGSTVGKWRYNTGDAPPFWTLSTSNGLFGLSNGSLTNLSIEYFGPWVEAPQEQSILSALSSFAGGSSMGFDPKSIFPGVSPLQQAGGVNLADFFGADRSKKGGYPSHATVTMTFKNNYSQVFGDEWLTFLTGQDSKINTGLI